MNDIDGSHLQLSHFIIRASADPILVHDYVLVAEKKVLRDLDSENLVVFGKALSIALLSVAGLQEQRAVPIARAKGALLRALAGHRKGSTILVLGHGASHDYITEACESEMSINEPCRRKQALIAPLHL